VATTGRLKEEKDEEAKTAPTNKWTHNLRTKQSPVREASEGPVRRS